VLFLVCLEVTLPCGAQSWTNYLYRHQSEMLSSKKNDLYNILCGRCLEEGIGQSVMLVFSTQLCELLPSNLLSGSSFPFSLCE